MNLWQKIMYSKKRLIGIIAILAIVVAVPLTVFISQKQQEIRQRAAETNLTDWYGQPLNLLKLFGQNKIGETARNKITGKGIDHGAGVIVDRSSSPNKVYVVDSGNNRILGFNGIGHCSINLARSCTIDADCANLEKFQKCVVDGNKDPDIVFGQSDPFSGTCNGDNNLGISKKPANNTLCLIGYPFMTNLGEWWKRVNIDVDREGSLYVPDYWNNRILKFNQPFSVDKSNGKGDTIADFVWGQDDFSSNGRNRSSQFPGEPFNPPDDHSLFISYDDDISSRGVSVDHQGNIWVADTFNGRILRFLPGEKNASLVLGQLDYDSRNSVCSLNSGGHPDGPLDKMCKPTLARLDPKTGKLYVADEYASFRARILVFEPPLTNGMKATKVIRPQQDQVRVCSNSRKPCQKTHDCNQRESCVQKAFYNSDIEKYYFQCTGFVFDPSQEGENSRAKLWVNDLVALRTLLINDDGQIIKVIGAPNQYYRGGADLYPYECKDSISKEFNIYYPGGSIGFDASNNIYLADEWQHRIGRYALPYQTRQIGDKTCLPSSNGGLFLDTEPNKLSDDTFNGNIGMVVFDNQLIVGGHQKMKIWNNYLQKSWGQAPDITISEGDIPGRILFSDAVDDQNRLWTYTSSGKLRIYQLPFTQNDQPPLADNIKLYWKDNHEEVSYRLDSTGITFDKKNKAIYIADRGNHRVLRVKNYNDFKTALYVDMVIGQPDKTTVKCNHIEDGDAGNFPHADSLCMPYQVKFDNFGNLYIVENTYECHGNDRITIFQEQDLQGVPPDILFPNLKARKALIGELKKKGPCAYNTTGLPGSPVAIAFTRQNQLVVGNDGYYGKHSERQLRQLWVYNDPLTSSTTKSTPDGYIVLPLGASGEIIIDAYQNLIVQDHTWNKIWIIHPGIDPFWLVPTSFPPIKWPVSGVIPPPTFTPTPIITRTPTPTITPTPTPTLTPGLPVGRWKLNDVSGNTAPDSSGYNHPGTLKNSPIIITGDGCLLDKCLSFNGDEAPTTSSSFVQIPDIVADTSKAHTYSLWAKPTALPGNGGLFGDWTGGVYNGTMFYNRVNPNTDLKKLCAYVSITSNPQKQTAICATPALNKWHHFALTYNGSGKMQYYVDGVLIGSEITIPDNRYVLDGGDFYIGTYNNCATCGFKGLINDVKVYNYVRSPAEVKADYREHLN